MIRFRLVCDTSLPRSVSCMGCGGALVAAACGAEAAEGVERVWVCVACRTEVVTVVADAPAPRCLRPPRSRRRRRLVRS